MAQPQIPPKKRIVPARAWRKGWVGGNSATPERIQKADNPAVLLVKSRTPHKSFLFLLEEKNRRAQIKNCEENFFAGWRGFRATAGLASLLEVLLKKFELRPKNTAKNHISKNQGWKPRLPPHLASRFQPVRIPASLQEAKSKTGLRRLLIYLLRRDRDFRLGLP